VTWLPGELVLLQEVWDDRVWAARPMRVVRDEGDSVALWFPAGTRWKAATTPPTRPREPTRGERLATCLASGEWSFVDLTWPVSTLWLMPEGAWHAVWVSWRDGGEFWGWYVNLQKPFRRTERGFETMDLMLDAIVDPDGSWRWKDEDELEAAVARGVFDEQLTGRIRNEALQVIRRAHANESPFDEPWPTWSPPRSWKTPELPPAWDERSPLTALETEPRR
jgi:predicted RNA-binding protein associated with RNAse of E/G family